MKVDDRIETYLGELDTKLFIPPSEYDILNDVNLSFGTQSRELKNKLLKEIEKLDAPYFDRHHLDAPNFELFVDNVLIGLCHISASYGEGRIFSALNCVTVHPQLRGYRLGTCLTKFAYIFTFKAVNAALVANKIKEVDWVFFADFDSEGGERVFYEAVEAVKAEMEEESIKYNCDIEAGY
ncbi:MAG: hypothetical protein V7749_00005 [Cocleimonas sp.]